MTRTDDNPLSFRGGAGVGRVSPRSTLLTFPHPNPSREGEGLSK
jgi:hypothetical protein